MECRQGESQCLGRRGQTRVDLAACYRAVAMMGWDDLVSPTLRQDPRRGASLPDQSLRLHVRGNHRLLTGQRLTLARQQAGRQPVSDQSCRLRHPQRNSRRARRRQMRAAYAQPERRCGQCAKGGVLPISQQSIFVLLANLAYHSYEGVALMDDETATRRRSRHQEFLHAAQSRPADGGAHHS